MAFQSSAGRRCTILVSMRRRHLLALVILALVVATVLVSRVGVRVWDALTTRTVTTYYDNGTPMERCRVRLWSGVRVVGHEGWHEDGALAFRVTCERDSGS